MYVGTQVAVRDDDDFRVFAQLGLKHICADPPGSPARTLDDLERHRDKVESFESILDMVQLPLPSRPIENASYPDILLAGPKRDLCQIDAVCRLIEDIAAAGIPAAKYNLNLIGIPRTPMEPGRGGSMNEAFRWEKADQAAAPGLAGELSEDENWERIDYFLKRVVPVAETNRVRLACHPHDRLHAPRLSRSHPRPWDGRRPEEIRDHARKPLSRTEFLPRGRSARCLRTRVKKSMTSSAGSERAEKIFNVHFRNIRGGKKLSFMETFPDEGDMDMVRSARVYKEVGYKYMLMPDHVPTISGRDPSGVAFAFCYGYIAALIEALETASV